MRHRSLLITALVPLMFLSTAPAFAVQGQLNAGANSYYLDTFTAGGQCIVTMEQNGSVTVQCAEGGSSVRANSATGCGVSLGGAGCAINTNAAGSSNQLNCTGQGESGKSYNISSGKIGDNNCTQDNSSQMTCRGSGSNTNSFASATCENGCGPSGGNGCCCEVGTSSCGGGTNCNTS